MKKIYLYIIVAAFLISYKATAQNNAEKALMQHFNKAATDSAKVIALGVLSEFYYAIRKENKGDSIIARQMVIAEQSRNKNLIIYALFNNAGYKNIRAVTRDKAERNYYYINKALEYAKDAGRNDYAALAYARLAAFYSTQGLTEQALINANLALTTAYTSSNDSIRIVASLQLGSTYLQKSEILMAFKMYADANDIANKINSPVLLSLVYHHISNMYKKLDKLDIAKDYIFKSLELNTANRSAEGRLDDYFALGKLYDYDIANDYLVKAEQLADSLTDIQSKMQAQRLLLYSKMIKRTPAETFDYLFKHPELDSSFVNTGPNYLTWIKGEIYLYGNMPDSALPYFKKAETTFDSVYDINSKKSFFSELAACYEQLNITSEAINYYEKSVSICKQTSDLYNIKYYSNELKKLYSLQNNFKEAYQWSLQYDIYKDSVDMLSREKDLALIEIDNQNKKRILDEELALLSEQRRHNLQYMGISVIVVSTFVLLIILGMFKVSTFTIRAMGFFSFIFLFEFIIMLLDTWIHNITHGEPWKVWGIKIAIISLLLPLHHLLEHRLIQYLLSKKLIHVRSNLSLRRWLSKLKNSDAVATSPVTEEMVALNLAEEEKTTI